MATAEPLAEGAEGTLAAAGDLVLRGSYGAVVGPCAVEEEEGGRDNPLAPFMAEFIGTFILVLAFGCVAASSSLTLSWKPTAVACTVTVMIYSTAMVSGGFLNPALSLSLSFLGVMPTSRWLRLCLVQCSAGLCAAATLRALVGVSGNGETGALAQLAAPLHLDVPPKALYPSTLVLLLELLYTAILCFVACCCLVLKRNSSKQEKSQSAAGLAIGLLYIAGGHALRLEAGAPAMNPAIALSVASMSPGGMQYGSGWIIAELLGALLGTYLFTWLRAGAEDSCEEFLELMAPRRPARLLAEFLGTFTYVLTYGLNIISFSESTAWSCSAALISMIYALGKTSGGHFNPAVTLAVVLSGRSVCPVADGLLYALVQIAAGLSAGLLVAVYHMNGPFAFLSLTPLPFKPWTDYGVVTVGIAEGVFTFVLAYATLACSTASAASAVPTVPTAGRRQNYFFGLAEGFCVMTGGCAVGSITGGMMNPAVAAGVWLLNLEELGSIKEAGISLGTCLKFSTWQCTGGLIAAVVFRITHPSEYCKAPLLVR